MGPRGRPNHGLRALFNGEAGNIALSLQLDTLANAARSASALEEGDSLRREGPAAAGRQRGFRHGCPHHSTWYKDIQICLLTHIFRLPHQDFNHFN